ncbi:hypothetical protein TEA_014165 [Camellia sinensis var. sinensis]|uniref:Peptidase S8/S53 domain-containing protein n=1 Tax=Camellia sinensis var. sinensis TaxID=542762 RepID=A0A4S4DSJ8_CAMSN|nr:hypothetical protein TEA_014165 [Camellia sinensis var. sinensis]
MVDTNQESKDRAATLTAINRAVGAKSAKLASIGNCKQSIRAKGSSQGRMTLYTIKPEFSPPSFNHEGVPPPLVKWKGKCKFKETIAACNNKLIRARNFPFNDVGYGTHTASTVTWNFVSNASVFGEANGTAAGMAPHAHLVIYKVCTLFGCFESNVLAGMDTAVENGVNILSISLGGDSLPFSEDIIAKGTFGAMQKGVFVSCSMSNSGPKNTSLTNEAPWILIVDTSTVDRSIRATTMLGNKEEYDGESLFQPSDFSYTLLPHY